MRCGNTRARWKNFIQGVGAFLNDLGFTARNISSVCLFESDGTQIVSHNSNKDLFIGTGSIGGQ